MDNPLYDALFARHAENDATFLIPPDGGRLSYRDFVARAGRFANALAALGLGPGDRLAAQVDKSADALALYAACARSGVVHLPLNPAYTASEVAYFLDDAGPRVFVCAPARRDDLAPAAAGAGSGLATLGAQGDGDLAEAADRAQEAFETAARGADDLAALLYTSGTTGRSKGAMLTQNNLLSNARALTEAWRFTSDDVLLHALPIFHTHGLFVATNVALLAGAAMILLPRFETGAVLECLPQATTMMGVPTFYTRLLEDDRLDRNRASSMRLFVSGSAPLLAETHRRFEARTGHRILERYGMTETNMITSNPHDGARRAGTVGMPLPGVTVRIVDPETGAPLAAGETGVIEVRGPNVFRGYWKMPEKTAAEFRPDGFFITGDLGRFDAEGYLQIVGRARDLVITGGFNVYPREIEAVLDAQPGVIESAVIGVAHPDLGEAVVGVLAIGDGPEPDLDAVLEAARSDLAGFKLPKRLVTVEELPRNAMGKVQKVALRERYASIFGVQALGNRGAP